MTAVTVDIGTLIARTPGVYGGRPCLQGTRFPVSQVAVLHNSGMSPEDMASEYELDVTAVYAGIAFYLANKAAVDEDLAESRRLYEEGAAAEREQPHYQQYLQTTARSNADPAEQ